MSTVYKNDKPGRHRKDFIDKVYEDRKEIPLMNAEEKARLVQIRAALETELKFDNSLKTYCAYRINKYRIQIAYMKDPISIVAGEVTHLPLLKCILTGEDISLDEECIVFFLKTGRDSYQVRAAIKHREHLSLVLKHGSFVKVKESLKPQVVRIDPDERKEEKRKADEFKLVLNRKYCTSCGNCLNGECADVRELAKKRRCNECMKNGKKNSNEFRYCRTCGCAFKPRTHLTILCPEHEIRDKAPTG